MFVRGIHKKQTSMSGSTQVDAGHKSAAYHLKDPCESQAATLRAQADVNVQR